MRKYLAVQKVSVNKSQGIVYWMAQLEESSFSQFLSSSNSEKFFPLPHILRPDKIKLVDNGMLGHSLATLEGE